MRRNKLVKTIIKKPSRKINFMKYGKDFIKNLWMNKKAIFKGDIITKIDDFCFNNAFLRKDLVDFYTYNPSHCLYNREEVKRLLISVYS